MKTKIVIRPLVLAGMFLLASAVAALAVCPPGQIETVPGGPCILDPLAVPQFQDPMIIPPVMPQAAAPPGLPAGTDYYEIAVRQFNQFILPQSMGMMTTVWSFGEANTPATFNYPAFTVEAKQNKPVRVKWINDLVDPATGNFLPHLLGPVVDQTLHWANPPQDCMDGTVHPDCRSLNPAPYLGPIPIIPHVHGAHVGPDSDGYPEAWWLPNANNIPAGYATKGSKFDQFDKTNAVPGTAVFQYPNDQRATTVWFHDHALGMTRQNVYAGPAGFWLIRGQGVNEPDLVAGTLPGPAPAPGDPLWLPAGKGNGAPPFREIPIVIQDRSFNPDGSLFYPDNRAFFEGITPAELQINFVPGSDVAPAWNPEAFFNTMVTNGRTWPYQNVEPVRYRLRLLNGCNSRFLNLSMFVYDPATQTLGAEIPFYLIGTEGGLLPQVVKVQTAQTTVLPGGAPAAMADANQALLVGPAERMDVIVDFTGLAPGTVVRMINTGPDTPFGGFPIAPLDLADPATTGRIMEFVLVPLVTPDASSLPQDLVLSPMQNVVPTVTRQVSLNEEESLNVCVAVDLAGAYVVPITQLNVAQGPNFLTDCAAAGGAPFGPTAAKLGTIIADPVSGGVKGNPLLWMDGPSETPVVGDSETWEIFNFTADAHPVHLHLVQFQVVDREVLNPVTFLPAGGASAAEPWESGWKDTVIAYPGAVTRIKAKFDLAGLYLWHCHILEHEDNEMMRAYQVVDQVAITSVTHDPATQKLTVSATSSGQPTETLTAVGLGPLVWKPWLNLYRATFNGVAAAPATVTVNSSAGGSAVYTAPPADTVAITAVAHDPVAQNLTVSATSNQSPGATLTAVGYGPLGWKSWLGIYRATFGGVASFPATVTVNSSNGGTATYTKTADTVTIVGVAYDNVGQKLTVTATSNQQPNAKLTAVGYGPLAWKPWLNRYRATFTGVLAAPASVTVNSDLGGTATSP